MVEYQLDWVKIVDFFINGLFLGQFHFLYISLYIVPDVLDFPFIPLLIARLRQQPVLIEIFIGVASG